MKVYLLTMGEYSDYRVLGVFDEAHQEEANRLAAMIGGCVEEGIEINQFNHDEPPPGMRFFAFTMFRDGSVQDGKPSEHSVLDCDGERHRCRYILQTKEDLNYDWIKPSYWRLTVWTYAKDEQHAVKIANEIRTQILAGTKAKQGDLP